MLAVWDRYTPKPLPYTTRRSSFQRWPITPSPTFYAAKSTMLFPIFLLPKFKISPLKSSIKFYLIVSISLWMNFSPILPNPKLFGGSSSSKSRRFMILSSARKIFCPAIYWEPSSTKMASSVISSRTILTGRLPSSSRRLPFLEICFWGSAKGSGNITYRQCPLIFRLSMKYCLIRHLLITLKT